VDSPPLRSWELGVISTVRAVSCRASARSVADCGPAVGIWYAIGLVYLVVLMRGRPERLRETGRVVMEEPEGTAAVPR
jgi:hypothetical protein